MGAGLNGGGGMGATDPITLPAGDAVRALGPQDAAAFKALRLRGLAEVPGAFASSAEEEEPVPLDEIARRLVPDRDGAMFGAFDGGVLCGLAGLRREAFHKLAHKAHLWGMYVAPEARGRGHAARLVERVLAEAWQTLQVRQVVLGVQQGNLPAIGLYRRFGFTVFGIEREALQVEGRLQDELHMVCHAPVSVAAPAAAAAAVHHAACSCGQLTLRAQAAPIRVSACHCLACQRRTGSVFGVQARFDAAAVTIEGASTAYTRTGDAGGRATFRFCPACGATVYYTIEGLDGQVVVPVGAFADPAFPAPTFSVYEERMHDWVAMPPGAEHMR